MNATGSLVPGHLQDRKTQDRLDRALSYEGFSLNFLSCRKMDAQEQFLHHQAAKILQTDHLVDFVNHLLCFNILLSASIIHTTFKNAEKYFADM